jgi:MEDS: MEthanogen/methylotroph, DcmR Sensory domain
METVGIQAGWSDSVIPLHTHICFYYRNEESLRKSLAFIRVGLDAPGELCLLFVGEKEQPEFLRMLEDDYGRPLEDRIQEGKLLVLNPSPSRQDVMVKFGAGLERGLAAGFTTIRLLGYPGFNKPGWPTPEDILALERDCNDVASAYPAVIVCAYGPELDDEFQVSGGKLHPHVWLKDDVEPNPIYAQDNGG